MWIILCDSDDKPADWAVSRLHQQGLAKLTVITAAQLVGATQSVHTIDTDGARFELVLADGRTLNSTEIGGALNRLSYLPAESLPNADPSDRTYAMAEVSALITTWLTCISSVTINGPVSGNWCGPWLVPMAWRQLAAAAGVPVASHSFSSQDDKSGFSPRGSASLVVLGQEVFGEEMFGATFSDDLASSCRELARLARVEMLGVTFEIDDRAGLQFVSATTLPDLRLGGTRLIEALHARLTTLEPT